MARSTHNADLSVLERRIGFDFRNKGILLQAVTHRSWPNEHREERAEHNERLEFLGDAVLELVVTLHLYRTVAREEGYLTNLRAALVRNKNLAHAARQIGLGEFIRMGNGERKDFDRGAKSATYILGSAFEAMIGAVCIDRGTGMAEQFVHELVLPKLQVLLAQDIRDPKSLLQELAQEKMGIMPTYRELSSSGPDHAKQFLVGVYLGPLPGGTGQGTSIREAQDSAAVQALHSIFNVVLSPELLPQT